jgi:hypothetical protein
LILKDRRCQIFHPHNDASLMTAARGNSYEGWGARVNSPKRRPLDSRTEISGLLRANGLAVSTNTCPRFARRS